MFQQSPPLSSVNRVNRAQKLLNLQAVFIQQTLKTANSDEEIAFKQKEKDMAAYSRSLRSGVGRWRFDGRFSHAKMAELCTVVISGDMWWSIFLSTVHPNHPNYEHDSLVDAQDFVEFPWIPSLTVLCSLICSERVPCCNMWVIRRKVKSLFQQVDSSGDGTLNLEECLDSESPNRCHIYSTYSWIICVCFFNAIRVYIYIYIYIVYIYIYIFMIAYAYYYYTCIYICVCDMHDHSYIYIYICTHTHMYIYIYVHIVVTSFVSKVPELGALYSQASPHFSTFSQDPSGPWAQVFQAGVFSEAEILDVTVGTWAPWHEPLSIGTNWCTWDVWNRVSMAGQLLVTSCKGTTTCSASSNSWCLGRTSIGWLLLQLVPQ